MNDGRWRRKCVFAAAGINFSLFDLPFNLSHLIHFRALLILCFAGSVQAAEVWQVDYQHSKIAFTAIQEGSTITGEFADFDAQVYFNETDLKSSRFDVEIATGSVDTASSDRDEILRSADFFDVSLWPSAHFKTSSISRVSENRYQAKATLAIRNVTREVIFLFDLKIRLLEPGNVAAGYLLEGNGKLTINRFDYELAQGDWRDPQVVGPEIQVSVSLKATRPGDSYER